jgi:nitrous oxidase accessory protein NosD
MSAQKNKTVLAATLAIVAVFLLGGVSFSFFPIQQPTQQELPIGAHIMWTKPTDATFTIVDAGILGPSNSSGYGYFVMSRYFPMDTICISSDGTLNATNGLIQQRGNTYTLTGNMVNQTILVQKDNVVLDGAGYSLQGWSQTIGDTATGISVFNRANVTITNFCISQFTEPIWIRNSSDITVKNNNLTLGYPLIVEYSSNNTITGNIISNGIQQLNVSCSTISRNTITGGGYVGLADYTGKENIIIQNSFLNSSIYSDGWDSTVVENTVINGGTGIRIEGVRITVYSNVLVNCTDGLYINGLNSIICKNSVYNASTGVLLNDNPYQPLTGNNTFYDNNFEGYSKAVHYWNSSTYTDHWDSGKEGNYWSSYNGSDGNGDGVGDAPYVLAENCADNYPLMQPYTAASINASLGGLFFAAAAVTALAGSAVIVCVYAKFKGRR